MAVPFLDRRHAGEVLGGELLRRGYPANSGGNPVLVLGLPRGGVPVGLGVAVKLNVTFDVFIVRKLGVPSHPELAMGAIASGGFRVLNTSVIDRLGIDPAIVDHVTEEEMEELVRRESKYRGNLTQRETKGALVILVDDGLATGASMEAAVRAIQGTAPAGVTVAVPTAPAETARRLRAIADEVICIHETQEFIAVGQWYRDFSQVTDEEVTDLLSRARRGSDGHFTQETA